MSNATIDASTLRLPVAAPDIMEQQSQPQTQAVPMLLPVAALQQLLQQGLLVITSASDIPCVRHVLKSVAENVLCELYMCFWYMREHSLRLPDMREVVY